MASYHVERYQRTRFWAVRDATHTLICVCVYKCGAIAVAERLQALDDAQHWVDTNGLAHEMSAPVTWGDPATWLL